MVDWAAARRMTERKVATVFDVALCTLQPRKQGISVNHAREDDDSRSPFDFAATIDLQPSGDLLARHRSSDTGARDANPYFDAVLSAETSFWPYEPKKGDRVISGSDVWEVSAPVIDGGARKAFYLTRA